MNSLEFVKQRILNGNTGLDWTEEEINAAEIAQFSVFMNGKNMPRTFGNKPAAEESSADELTFMVFVDGKKDNGQLNNIDDGAAFPAVSVEYTPENDFDYFISETYEDDGTFVFFSSALRNLIQRIDTGSSYNKEKADDDFLKNPSLYSVSYKVGDVVVMRRYKQVINADNFSFPGEKVSICIPIKWDCEKQMA